MPHEAEQFELPLFRPDDESTPYIVYTDGSCLINPGGPGGWACVILRGGRELWRLKGGEPKTTNNRQEMMAVIKALEKIEPGATIIIRSDSKYVVNGAMKFCKSWIRRQWRGVKNPDLWQQLIALKDKRDCTLEWIRGHNGDYHNEVADKLANEEAKKQMFPESVKELQ